MRRNYRGLAVENVLRFLEDEVKTLWVLTDRFSVRAIIWKREDASRFFF